MSAPSIPNTTLSTLRANLNAALAAVWSAFQTQDATAWTTTGTAPAFILTPTPVLASYVANQRFRVRFSANATAPTLNVSGLGVKNIKILNALGVKIAAVIYANMLVDCEFDGTDWLILSPCQPRNSGVYRNYKASCSGSSASIPMTADLVTVRDLAGSYIELAGVSVTLNTATTGANGMQAAIAINTWYEKGVIYNPTSGATAAFGWPQGTSPTLPSGYTHWMRMGAFLSDGTANKYPMACKWVNAHAQFVVTAAGNVTFLPLLCSGVQGTFSSTAPTWAAVAIAGGAPPTAIKIKLVLINFYKAATLSYVMVAPNNNYGGYANASGNIPPAMINIAASAVLQAEIELESANIYVASGNTGAAVACLGYEDSI